MREKKSTTGSTMYARTFAADEQTSRRADLHLEHTSTEHGTMTRQSRDFRFSDLRAFCDSGFIKLIRFWNLGAPQCNLVLVRTVRALSCPVLFYP